MIALSSLSVVYLFWTLHYIGRIAQYGGWYSEPSAPYQTKQLPLHKLRVYMGTLVTSVFSSTLIESIQPDWIDLSLAIPATVVLLMYGIKYHHNLPDKKKELITDYSKMKRKK